MLRLVFILLLLANGGYYAWTHGALRGFGLGPTTQSEPQRLTEQIHPDRLVVLGPAQSGTDAASGAPAAVQVTPAAVTEPRKSNVPSSEPDAATPPSAASSAGPAKVPADQGTVAAGANGSSPAPPEPQATSPLPTSDSTPTRTDSANRLAASTTSPATSVPTSSPPDGAAKSAGVPPALTHSSGRCLEAGPFNDAEAAAVRNRAAALLPANAWSMVSATLSGRWMVYMGRYPDAQTLEKKRAELRARDVTFAVPGDAALQPGLSLGLFSSQQSAESALADLAQEHGIRTARVVQVRPPQSGHSLRLPAVDAALKPALEALAPALAGHTLTKCE